MAYTDLVSTQTTMVAGGATYNFSFDSPISADGSPHITHMGIQLNLTSALAQTITNGPSGIITDLRVKVGSNIIMNWNNNAAYTPTQLSQFGVLVQRIGGQDYCVASDAAALTTLSELSWPVGLDATRSHRVNVSITLGTETNMITQALVPATSEMNVSLNYGLSKEATIIGSRQDFTMTANATRIITVFGKQGWNMLGVFCSSNNPLVDEMTSARVNNGAFRELLLNQWRALNNSFGAPDATQLRLGAVPDVAATGVISQQTMISGQAGSVFLNLRRITAGANIDVAFTYNAADTLALYPVWVAKIGAGTGTAPRQTISQAQSTTNTVEANTQG